MIGQKEDENYLKHEKILNKKQGLIVNSRCNK